MNPFPNITTIFLDTIVAGVLHWLLPAAHGNEAAAREAAINLLTSYNVETEQELRLAAEITSHSLSALDSLARSTNPGLSLNAVLRLRLSANASQRSKNQCQRTLDLLRKERAPKAEPRQPETAAEPTPDQPEFHISRQQRRALERVIEKTQRKQAEAARLQARKAAQMQQKAA